MYIHNYNKLLWAYSLVHRLIPSFSMLHTEKQEGLVREVMCVTCPIEKQ